MSCRCSNERMRFFAQSAAGSRRRGGGVPIGESEPTFPSNRRPIVVLRRPIVVCSTGDIMSEIAAAKPKPNDLGVTLGGSARTGHSLTLSRKDALSEIFGTADADQASAF